MEATTYYLRILKSRFAEKQRMNSSYSLRAFARDLSLHPATLSQIFKGKRELPKKNIRGVILKLGLSPVESTRFSESLFGNKTRLDSISVSRHDDRLMLDESHFKVIAEWEHYAVLSLFDLTKFKLTPQRVSLKLGIPKTRAEVVLDNLQTSGLLSQMSSGAYRKSIPAVRTTEDVTSAALQIAHQDTLEIAKKKLEEVSVELRDYSSSTLALDPEKIPEAKTIIREFRRKMAALLKDGNKKEVYQLAIQFFPLTKTKNKGVNSI